MASKTLSRLVVDSRDAAKHYHAIKHELFGEVSGEAKQKVRDAYENMRCKDQALLAYVHDLTRGSMKRFALFTGRAYYPSGGWHDCKATADTSEELVERAANEASCYLDWWHVVDLFTGEIVKEGRKTL